MRINKIKGMHECYTKVYRNKIIQFIYIPDIKSLGSNKIGLPAKEKKFFKKTLFH